MVVEKLPELSAFMQLCLALFKVLLVVTVFTVGSLISKSSKLIGGSTFFSNFSASGAFSVLTEQSMILVLFLFPNAPFVVY